VQLDRLVPFRDDAALVRIFCLPHAGGSAAFYLPLRRRMPPGIDFCPLELPGRAGRVEEPLLTTMSALIDHLADALPPLLHVPFAWFGHSAGALMAYAAARQLRARDGRGACHVFVSGHAPARPTVEPPLALSDSDLLGVLSRLGATPPSVLARRDLMSLVLPAVRADLAVAATCQAHDATPIACPLTAFAGADDAAIEPGALTAWGRSTSGPFRLRLFDGRHFYLSHAADDLVRELLQDLDTGLGADLAGDMRQMELPAAHREPTP
jgi:medium-chain acyl-[acyl-carrier-protein] hydrolase